MKLHKSSLLSSTDDIIPPSLESTAQKIEDCKRDLIQMCDGHDLESGYSSIIEAKIGDLETLGEEVRHIDIFIYDHVHLNEYLNLYFRQIDFTSIRLILDKHLLFPVSSLVNGS